MGEGPDIGQLSASRRVQRSTRSRWRALSRRLPRWLLFAAAVAVLAFAGVVLYRLFVFLREFNDAVAILSQRYGMNQWLAKALALAFLGPLGWVVKRAFFGFGKHRTLLRMASGAYACAYFLGMFFISRNVAFSHATGEALLWCAQTPEGERCFDSPGFDPKYGLPLTAADPGRRVLAERRRLGQVAQRVDERSAERFFDPLSGEPLVWYSRDRNGGFVLFDQPGFDPKSQAPLEPVTPDTVDQIRVWLEQQDHARSVEKALAHQQARQAEEARERAARIAEDEAFRSRYLNRSVGGQRSWAVVVVGADRRVTDDIESAISSALESKGVQVARLFRPSFAAEGLAARLASGDDDIPRRLELSRFCRAILLASVSNEQLPGAAGLEVVNLTARLSVLDPASGSVRPLKTLSEKGGGATLNQAIGRAQTQLADSLARELPGAML